MSTGLSGIAVFDAEAQPHMDALFERPLRYCTAALRRKMQSRRRTSGL
jgi:hypothetical protein